MLGSVSVIGAVSIIPLSAINISTSNPSRGLEVVLKKASNGQNETKSMVATMTANVERNDGGGIGVDELVLVLFSTEVFLSFSVIESALLSFSSSRTKLSSSASVAVSKNGSRLALHVVVCEVNAAGVSRKVPDGATRTTGNVFDSVANFCRHRPRCCDFPSVDNASFCTDSRLSVVTNSNDRHDINNSFRAQSFIHEENTTMSPLRSSNNRRLQHYLPLSYGSQSMSCDWR